MGFWRGRECVAEEISRAWRKNSQERRDTDRLSATAMMARKLKKMKNAVTRILWTAVASVVLATTAMETRQKDESAFPPRLESYLTKDVSLTAAERRRLRGGGPVTKLLDVDESKEVSVFGAIWINAPMHRYVEAIQDIESFERGPSFSVTKRISPRPTIHDFAQLRLPEQDVQSLRACRVGDCDVKLDAKAIQRFRTEVDWNGPEARDAADTLMRQIALEYVAGYLEGGNSRLAVYRDHSRPTFAAKEFREMIDQMPELTNGMPDVRRYLLSYPQTTLPDSTSFLYWQIARFGLKPTFRISHVTIRERPTETVVASKMLHASHYFWTAIELRTLLPDPSRGPGFWFVTVNRSRSDGLSGFTGMFVRGRVRTRVRDGVLSVLQTTRQKLEGIAVAGYGTGIR